MRPLIHIGDGTDACWKWLGKTLPGGYGCKQFDNRTILAHRWIFQMFNGWLPKEAVLDHLCRNRSCVNPMHLEIVSQAENIRRGASTKLTRHQAAKIKRLLLDNNRQGDRKRIAEQFGISPALVSDIRYGRAWRDVAPSGNSP